MTEIEKFIEEKQVLINKTDQFIQAGRQSVKKAASLLQLQKLPEPLKVDIKQDSEMDPDKYSDDVKDFAYSFINPYLSTKIKGRFQARSKQGQFIFKFV